MCINRHYPSWIAEMSWAHRLIRVQEQEQESTMIIYSSQGVQMINDRTSNLDRRSHAVLDLRIISGNTRLNTRASIDRYLSEIASSNFIQAL